MKKLLFLLLPLFLFGDNKFVSPVSLDTNKTATLEKAANIIEDELKIKLNKNLQSEIYIDEAALYALKNALARFAVVRKDLLEELGLKFDDLSLYGFEALYADNDIIVLSTTRFMDGFSKSQKTNLTKRLKTLKN